VKVSITTAGFFIPMEETSSSCLFKQKRRICHLDVSKAMLLKIVSNLFVFLARVGKTSLLMRYCKNQFSDAQ